MREQRKITIGSRDVGPDEPLLIIAECGITCNYDMEITKDLIDVVADSGADAIKFLFWFPDEIMSDRSVDYTYETVNGTKSENMYEMLNELRFTLDEWRDVKEYADQRGVLLFSTVNSPTGVEWAEELDLDAYKLSSWDYNHHPLWRKIASKGKPMLIDTGPVTNLEVSKVMNILKEEDNEQSVLLHCFHTDEYDEMNMKAIPYMREAFHTLVGYSAPDRRDEMDIMAVTDGACVLEKRLTMDRELPGHHHILSKEPDEFETYVEKMRNVRAARGVKDLQPSQEDLRERTKYFRQIVADQDIPAGTELTADMLAGKRPATGISPEFMELFVGRKTKQEIQRNEALSWKDI